MKAIVAAITSTFATSASKELAPTEFAIQVLEPTGGSILRPKSWFYTEGHRGPVYLWTIAREDRLHTGRYTTGVRIQMFADVKNGTGKSAKQFILDLLSNRKKEASKVLRSCAAKDQGIFTHTCIETEEGQNRFVYSLFWDNDNLDIAVVTIAGTKKRLWDIYSPTFDKMSAFELIDLDRYQERSLTS